MKKIILKRASCIICIVSLLVIQGFGQTDKFSLRKINSTKSEFTKPEPEERSPISYGILIDTSAKMKELLPTAVKIAKNLIAQGQPNDDFFITDVKNTSNIELVKDFSGTVESANKALDNVVATLGSSLLDGIVVSGEYLLSGKNKRKILIVISDGVDSDSEYNAEQTISKLKEYHVELYVICIGSLKDKSQRDDSLQKNATKLINKLVSQVGGKEYFLSSSTDVDSVVEKIITSLNQ